MSTKEKIAYNVYVVIIAIIGVPIIAIWAMCQSVYSWLKQVYRILKEET